jgi:hypothetical protein
LGIGAVLYLQILKTFLYLFIVLTVINIPIIGFYLNSSVAEFNSYDEIFAYFTLGNLGRGDQYCGHKLLNHDEKIELSCGKNVFLKEISRYGILYKDYLPKSLPANGEKECEDYNRRIMMQKAKSKSRRLMEAF